MGPKSLGQKAELSISRSLYIPSRAHRHKLRQIAKLRQRNERMRTSRSPALASVEAAGGWAGQR